MNFIRSALSSFSKQKLKVLFCHVTKFLEEHGEEFVFSQWYFAILDIIEYKLYRPENPKPKKQNKLRCNLDFVNKGLDFINLAKILRNPLSIQNLPVNISKDNLPMITYKLGETIRHTIFNYKSFVKDLDVDNILGDIDKLPCNCEGSPFIDNNHGHIITGNLKIIKNNKLRKLLTYGPKYREPSKIDWGKCKSSIKSTINECIEKLSKKHAVHKTSLLNGKKPSKID